jgi:membrane associated rhomboid family serine protease
MLENRDYMRQPASRLNGSATVVLIATLVVAFILRALLVPQAFADTYLALSLEGLRHGFVWQLLTFQFLHAGWMHLLFNSLAIYFFGRSVEMVLGPRRWCALYFLSGIVGGLVQMGFALALPSRFDAPVVGASAGGAGLIAAFAVLNWEDRFTLILYFVPVAMRGKTLFWFSIGFALLGAALGGGGVAHAAHLGGFLTGFAFVRWGEALQLGLWRRNLFPRRERSRQLVKAASIRIPRWAGAQSGQPDDPPPEEFISREVDPILDKISAHGIQSLTERERRVLEAARNKMAKR